MSPNMAVFLTGTASLILFTEMLPESFPRFVLEGRPSHTAHRSVGF